MPRPRAAEALYRASLFVLPFAIGFAYVVSLLAVLPRDAWDAIFLVGMATYLLAPVGTEIVIPILFVRLFALDAPPIAFVLGVASVVLVDVLTALFFLWNWDLLEGVPRLGGALRRVEDRCRAVVARRAWGERATYGALAAYVALPFQMTGGLFGSVLGRVMGLDRVKVFAAVSAGSLAGGVPVGVVSYLVGALALNRVVADLTSPTAQAVGLAAGILITAAFIAVVAWLYVRGRRNAD